MLEEADYQATEMALGRNPRYAGDDKLWVQFHILPMISQEESDKEGRPIFKDVEHVRIMTPGNKDSIVDRPVTHLDIQRFKTQYQQWKADEQEMLTGTPLESVARDPLLMITPSQVEELKYFKIRTVEQLAGIADVHAQGHMGLSMLKTRAVEYLEKAKDTAATTRLQAELETRDNKISTLEQALASLQEQLRAVQQSQEKKTGRTRAA